MKIPSVPGEVDLGFLLIGGTCAVLLAGITAAMIWFAVRYRRGRVRTTSQVESNLWLEVTWTVIPTIIVTWMFFVGYRGFRLIRQVPEDAMTVEVTGRQWAWSFRYPETDLESAELYVPAGRAVRLHLTAPEEDVLHSFFIPDVRVKEDVIPGRVSTMWFRAGRPGVSSVFCAEYCGKDHSAMITKMHVLAEPEYEEWVRGRIAEKFRPVEPEAVARPDHPGFATLRTEERFRTFCASCHGAQGDGSGLPGVARDFRSLEGWKRSPRVSDVYRTLMTGVEGTQMRPYPNFTPWERLGLAHHVRGFLGDRAPAPGPGEFEDLAKEYGLDRIQPPRKTLPIERAMEIYVEENRGR